jgi:hypothetical protein
MVGESSLMKKSSSNGLRRTNREQKEWWQNINDLKGHAGGQETED